MQIDAHRYKTLASFLADIELLVENARQYNDPLVCTHPLITKHHLKGGIAAAASLS